MVRTVANATVLTSRQARPQEEGDRAERRRFARLLGPDGVPGRGDRDIAVVARTFRFSGFHSGAAHIISRDLPIQLRHAGTPVNVDCCWNDPGQKHDPGASIHRSERWAGTTTNAQAMATSHNLRSHEIAPRLRPRLHSVLTQRWSPSSTALLAGATS